MTRDIVIVGGGFGGTRLAKILAKERDIHITLIDKSRYHTFYPNLYEVATAHLPEVFGHLPIDFLNLKSSAIYPLEDIFLDNLNVTVLEDEVVGVDFKKNKVELNSGALQHYDILVLGAGSVVNYFGISGMEAKALPLKNFFDALSIRNAVDEAFYKTPKNQLVKIVIGGGGFTGCELAGELIGYMKKLTKIHGHPEYYAECLIVEAADTLLGSARKWIQKKAKARLEKLGVRFKFKSGIKAVEDGKVVLQDGSKISYDVLIWTAGVKANDLTKSLFGVKLEKGACLMVDKHLRIMPYENVFGVGDITYCVDGSTGKFLPMTASVAIREAKCVAKNIKRMIAKKPLINYKPHHAGFVIPLGGKYALLELAGIRLSGFIPWVLKHMVSLRYWTMLIGLRRALAIWRKSLRFYTEND